MTISILLMLAQSGFGAPAPRSDVAWCDSCLPWLDMLVREVGGESRPHVTLSVLQQDISDNYEIHTSHWTGTDWQTDIVRRGLLHFPRAVTAWRGQPQLGLEERIYAFHRGGLPVPELAWGVWDVTNGVWGNEQVFGDIVGPPWVRPSLAIRAIDNDPAVAWFHDDGVNGPGTYYARWDSLQGQVRDLTHLPACSGNWPTLLLDAQDQYHVSCREDQGNNEFDINYVYQGPMGPQNELVFGGGDAHWWQFPAMAFMDNYPVIVAYDTTAQEIAFRVRWPLGWTFPVTVLQNMANVRHVAVDAVGDGAGGGTIAITVLTSTAQIFTDFTIVAGVGSQGPIRRVDLNPGDLLGVCEQPNHASSVKLTPDGEHVLTSWVVKSGADLPGNSPIMAARFAQFDRDDTADWTRSVDMEPVKPTSLALDADGDGWTCFYDESVNGSPEVDLFVRFRDEPPVVIDSDTGSSVLPNSRGCDVAVAPDGTVGVLWSHNWGGAVPVDAIRYRAFDGVAWGQVEDLQDGAGIIANRGHLALTFDTWSNAHAVFTRYTTDDHAWIGHRIGGWTFEKIDTYVGGFYPDIVYLPSSDKAHVSFTTSSPVRTVTYAHEDDNYNWRHASLVQGDLCFDTSIATREVDGTPFIAVAWTNYGTAQLEFAYVDDTHAPMGGGVVEVIDDSPGFNDYLAIEIDAEGEVAVTYRKTMSSGSPRLRFSNVRPFSGGRDKPDPPDPARLFCDFAISEHGTDLDFDRFDNPRVVHRTEEVNQPVLSLRLDYVSRP